MTNRDQIAADVGRLASSGNAHSVLLWDYPEREHVPCLLEGFTEVTFDEHLLRLQAVTAECERRGITVIRTSPLVREIAEILKEFGLSNTPNGRAEALGLYQFSH